MITQQEIVDEINRLTLHYNVSWQDIKMDADRAIGKINNFLGTIFPKMSEVLDAPSRPYAFRSGSTEALDVAYFDDEYVWSIIVPFVAMQVLARDEEFTLVYQKYEKDVNDGLFDMFQQSFNTVPMAFRQNPDVGVFFASESAKGIIARNNLADLPVYKFKVYYHVNDSNIVMSADVPFVSDPTAHLYGALAIIRDWDEEVLSVDGVWAYTFDGWYKDPGLVSNADCAVGAEVKMITDVHLYAKWIRTSTLTCTPTGTVSIKDEYIPMLVNLVIPNIVDNSMVRVISERFLWNNAGTVSAENLVSITLPDYLTTIETFGFYNFLGTEIIFPTTIKDDLTYEGITISEYAFAMCDNLLSIVLPANIAAIETGAFPRVAAITRKIYCRILEQNKPDAWATGWAEASDSEGTAYRYVNYVIWGYNG